MIDRHRKRYRIWWEFREIRQTIRPVCIVYGVLCDSTNDLWKYYHNLHKRIFVYTKLSIEPKNTKTTMLKRWNSLHTAFGKESQSDHSNSSLSSKHFWFKLWKLCASVKLRPSKCFLPLSRSNFCIIIECELIKVAMCKTNNFGNISITFFFFLLSCS